MTRSVFVKLGFAAFLAAAPLLPACLSAPDGTEDVESTGRASMSLVTQTNGRVYRLSNAIFSIQGPVFTYLTSTDDPNETTLTAALPTGDYLSVLEPGWVLERDDGWGAFVPVQATLASGNPVPFTIFDGATTPLVYQFQTDGTIITVGEGQLDISIEVTEVGVGGACTPLGAGCADGEWCVPGEVLESAPACLTTGDIPIGGACDAPDSLCVANALCGDFGSGAVCIELCPASDLGAPCASGGICSDIGYTEFGICY
ncbi:hypothetical protein SOCE26_066580 [Sorangium cellulosum]|uniref:Secreted protein n=1 Tax=Sorangium cellulosum TaxID=56 RepID=A0A2L0F0W7_SORCE|nr:hypothetical protein [Sorangium cellulosum]AUX45177.1 hypothetical protein SOCE26_066580 [Sorangium cellulosum]